MFIQHPQCQCLLDIQPKTARRHPFTSAGEALRGKLRTAQSHDEKHIGLRRKETKHPKDIETTRKMFQLLDRCCYDDIKTITVKDTASICKNLWSLDEKNVAPDGFCANPSKSLMATRRFETASCAFDCLWLKKKSHVQSTYGTG